MYNLSTFHNQKRHRWRINSV